ncbi:MAG TPA: alpha/beta hydrolase [Actinomycetes bacterium]|nr:alpha/beta hydrolase [Actinomycetes bacterium]
MPQEDRSILSRASSAAPVTVAYGDHPEQVAEIWASSPDAPLVIVVHGGFWKQQYDRSHCRGLAMALSALDVTTVLLEYRRVGGDGGWPTTFDDVRIGLRKIVQHHPRASRRIVVGHSAGGQLALWATTTEPVPTVDAVIGLAAIADLTEMARLFEKSGDENPVHDVMGGGPEDRPDRYDLADPARLPAPHASVRLLHGVHDTVVPLELSASYAARHPGVSLAELPCGHFELIDPRSVIFTHVQNAVIAELPDSASGVRRSRPW